MYCFTYYQLTINSVHEKHSKVKETFAVITMDFFCHSHVTYRTILYVLLRPYVLLDTMHFCDEILL